MVFLKKIFFIQLKNYNIVFIQLKNYSIVIHNIVLVQMYSEVIQLYICVYSFFRFFSLIDYYKVLSTVPCVTQ